MRQVLDTAASYLNTWFPSAAVAGAAVASSGGLCGAGPVSNILAGQYFGCGSSTHNSEMACNSDAQCTWTIAPICYSYLNYLGQLTQYCFGSRGSCVSTWQANCPQLSLANCSAPGCVWSARTGQC